MDVRLSHGDIPPPGPGRIVWLASYPKSGNTWMRVVLGHLMGRTEANDNINDVLIRDGISSDRDDFDDFVGVYAADLPYDTVETLRPRVYECLSREARDKLFLKAHDAYALTPGGEPLFPIQATYGVVHIVRNPLDVAVSWAHHFDVEQARAVRSICDPDNALCGRPNRLHDQLRQRLLDWSGHAASWLAAPLPRLTLRYEDMLAQPHATFLAAARFCGIAASPEAIDQAVEASRFDRLSDLEARGRFRESLPGTSRFFRQGRAGGWREGLTQEQAAIIVARHRDMMLRLGYATEVAQVESQPIFPHNPDNLR